MLTPQYPTPASGEAGSRRAWGAIPARPVGDGEATGPGYHGLKVTERAPAAPPRPAAPIPPGLPTTPAEEYP
ncbi:hypothetical protein Ssi03_56270 [Sphaerisporangium siamense]|nr:hypothetical protein Ssi03_56270 [Sphaerisporangium siamense]